jgi:hypothetical protein
MDAQVWNSLFLVPDEQLEDAAEHTHHKCLGVGLWWWSSEWHTWHTLEYNPLQSSLCLTQRRGGDHVDVIDAAAGESIRYSHVHNEPGSKEALKHLKEEKNRGKVLGETGAGRDHGRIASNLVWDTLTSGAASVKELYSRVALTCRNFLGCSSNSLTPMRCRAMSFARGLSADLATQKAVMRSSTAEGMALVGRRSRLPNHPVEALGMGAVEANALLACKGKKGKYTAVWLVGEAVQ